MYLAMAANNSSSMFSSKVWLAAWWTALQKKCSKCGRKLRPCLLMASMLVRYSWEHTSRTYSMLAKRYSVLVRWLHDFFLSMKTPWPASGRGLTCKNQITLLHFVHKESADRLYIFEGVVSR